MIFIDDPSVIRKRSAIFTVQIKNTRLEQPQELFFDRLVDQDIIRGDTGLAGIDHFAVNDTPGGNLQLGVGMDDAGALAAQLQGDRGQVLGRGFHDDTAHVGTAGEEDVVKALLQQLGGLRNRAGNIGHIGGIETLLDESLDRFAAGRRQLGSFQYRRVARGQGRDQGHEGQGDGVIERRDDQIHPQGGI